MKNLLLAYTLLMGFTAFSQGLTLGKEPTKEIKLEKRRFYIDGTQIPSYQMKKVFASNIHSLNLYKKVKTKETLGATLLGLGATVCVIDLAVGLFSDVKYPTALTYAGLGVVAISIPILSGRAKKMEEAVKTYNEGLKDSGLTDFDLNALANQNGVGIQIQF